jgi:hypothetical protein
MPLLGMGSFQEGTADDGPIGQAPSFAIWNNPTKADNPPGLSLVGGTFEIGIGFTVSTTININTVRLYKNASVIVPINFTFWTTGGAIIQRFTSPTPPAVTGWYEVPATLALSAGTYRYTANMYNRYDCSAPPGTGGVPSQISAVDRRYNSLGAGGLDLAPDSTDGSGCPIDFFFTL